MPSSSHATDETVVKLKDDKDSVMKNNYQKNMKNQNETTDCSMIAPVDKLINITHTTCMEQNQLWNICKRKQINKQTQNKDRLTERQTDVYIYSPVIYKNKFNLHINQSTGSQGELAQHVEFIGESDDFVCYVEVGHQPSTGFEMV